MKPFSMPMPMPITWHPVWAQRAIMPWQAWPSDRKSSTISTRLPWGRYFLSARMMFSRLWVKEYTLAWATSGLCTTVADFLANSTGTSPMAWAVVRARAMPLASTVRIRSGFSPANRFASSSPIRNISPVSMRWFKNISTLTISFPIQMPSRAMASFSSRMFRASLRIGNKNRTFRENTLLLYR